MRPFALDRMDLKNIMKNSPTRLVSLIKRRLLPERFLNNFFARIHSLRSSKFLEVDYVRFFFFLLFLVGNLYGEHRIWKL